MLLVHKFQLKPNKDTSIILSSLTYASARLFNVGNYERHEYENLGFDKMPDWYDQKKRLKENMWFKSLPSQTAQDVLQRVDEGWKSYFKLLKTKGINNPKPPFYKPKGSHMLYMMHFSEGEFKTSHYAICTAFMALSMLLPGMVAGYIQEAIGYVNFFWMVMVCCIATLIVTFFADKKIDPSYGKK